MASKSPLNSSGFTLIEIIVAITIMAFLSLYTAQSINQASKSKVKIQATIDRQSTSMDALNVISRDIQYAFNYRDISIELYNLAQETRKERDKKKQPATPKEGETPPATPPATPPEDEQNSQNKNNYELKKEVIVTQFIGKENELHFTTLSNVRLQRDSKTSDQAEVSYKIKNCRPLGQESGESTPCLFRRISPYIDNNLEEGGSETVLVENVAEFKLRYIGPGREEEWVNTWQSNENGDDITKGKFPYAVEVTLGILNPLNKKAKPYTVTKVAPLKFPNNPPPKTEAEGAEGQNNEAPQQ